MSEYRVGDLILEGPMVVRELKSLVTLVLNDVILAHGRILVEFKFKHTKHFLEVLNVMLLILVYLIHVQNLF